MLDARVGQQPLEVLLADHERQRDGQAQEPEPDQQVRREARPQARDRDEVEADQGVERGDQRHARKQRADRAGRLAVGVGQPGVERRQADLGAVARQREDERQPQQARVQLRRDRDEARPVQRVGAVAQDAHGRGVGEQRREQREADADRAQDQVLPGRLDRVGRAVDADQQGRDDGRGLDGDPQQAQVVDERHGDQAGHEPQEQGVVVALVARPQPAGRRARGGRSAARRRSPALPRPTVRAST